MKSKQVTWKKLLKKDAPVLLPSAHDALTAKLIERAGFAAFQVGGFALNGARHGFPDLDLTHFGEEVSGVREILHATTLPVMVDADDGYGDAKNVTRTIRAYERLGASALFFEDQVAPKRCGHLAGKSVVPAEVMVAKVRAAVAARQDPDFYLMARTDAVESHGVDEALRRAEKYLEAGADGIFVEGPRTVEEIERIASGLKGASLAVNMFEGGGKTPWMSPGDLHALGFQMILFPTTLLFRVTKALERALVDLKEGRPMPPEEGVDLDHYEEIVGLPEWEAIEKEFHPEGAATRPGTGNAQAK